ncbi:uncharacterized protein EV420DRAFT_1553901 [Desarmillaria tabescens]|uniref:Uncharacterized protein n=1 Tax=Armillaria tabescens TaxID=1929756 RepID=A0AA39K8P9_ARMTA|nr:uncharacterized protein EV420DRAFT_1553901 [Desarmillaria tabescens]KAK0455490.1 hypothetical protein EV420DRAFT_1553901 [Desarmillaria tabescens]
MENLTLPFKDIGRPPALLHRFTSAHPSGIEPSPSPSPPPEQYFDDSSPSTSRSRPTLMQVLGTGLSDTDAAGDAASTSGDAIPGLMIQPSSSIASPTVPSVITLPTDTALLNASEWQLRYPSSEPPKSDPHTHPSSTPLPASTIEVVPPASDDIPLQSGNSLETLIKLKDQLLSSLASYTPPNPSTGFLLAKASREQSSAALDAAKRAHALAQQSLSSVQECANVAHEALVAAERAHSLAENATAAIDKLKTDNEPWKVLEEAVRTELASLTQWIASEEQSRLLAETRRLANSARDLDASNDASGENPHSDRATQLSRGSINGFEAMPDSDIVMGSPDDLRNSAELPHEKINDPPVPDDDLRRRQEIQRRLDEAMAAAEAKRLEGEARDLALRKVEEERLQRVKDAEIAARRAREEEEAEILQARQQREKEKKLQAEQAEAQRAAQEKERREAEEALANRSREVERRRALELKLAEQKKQREEVQLAKMQYNRVQAARIHAERAKVLSADNATSLAPPPPASSLIPPSNGTLHPSASEAVPMNSVPPVPTVPSSQPQVSPPMPLSSLPTHPTMTSSGPASMQIGSVGAQRTSVEVPLPVQAPKQFPLKGNHRALSGEVKPGTTPALSTDPPPSLIHTASLGLRPRVSETSPVPSALLPVDTTRLTHALPSKPDSTSPSDIISPCIGILESQRRLSTDRHSVPPIDHLPQSHLGTPESETMVPYSTSDSGNVPIIKMENMDELFHVQEANLRHIRERTRIDPSQMVKAEEAGRQGPDSVSQPPQHADGPSDAPSPVPNVIPLNNMPASALPPIVGSLQTSITSVPQEDAAHIHAQSTPAAATNSPSLLRKPKKAKASKTSPTNQIASQPSRGNQHVASTNQPTPQTNRKAPPPPVNQKAPPAKQQARVAAVPAPKPPIQKKTPTKPRSTSPLTGQVDLGRTIHNRSSYSSGSSTSRVSEPRGPSPMGPEGFPSENGWHNACPVDEDPTYERHSYEPDRYSSSSNRRGCYSPTQDYPNAPNPNSYDRRCDYYSPSPPPSPRGRPMSPIARSPSPTLGMKRRRREESAFVRNGRQRQEDGDPYSRVPMTRARGIPSRPQTPPAVRNRDTSPPPTLVSRLGTNIDYTGDKPAADYHYSAALAHPPTYSYKSSRRLSSPPPRISNGNNLLGRLSNGRGGGNSKPRLAARIGDAGINDSY